jgi:hypothetical protein
MATQPSHSELQEAVEKVANANIPCDPDFDRKFLEKGSYPSFFRGVYVHRIISDTDGSAGQVEFMATAHDDRKYYATRVIPLET